MHQLRIQQIKSHLTEQFNLPADQIEQLLPSFIDTLNSHMQNLESALKDNNPLSIGAMSHTVKGAFLNLGLNDCATLALDIEMKGKAGDREVDYKKMVAELQLLLSFEKKE